MSKGSLNTDHTIQETNDYIHGSSLNVKYDFPPLYILFSSYKIRERTFDNFPRCLKHLITKLVNAGYWYKNERDVIYCYFCGGALCNLPIDMTENMINIAHIFKNMNCPLVSNILRTSTFIEDFIKYEIKKKRYVYIEYLHAINVRSCSEYDKYLTARRKEEQQTIASDGVYRVPITLSSEDTTLHDTALHTTLHDTVLHTTLYDTALQDTDTSDTTDIDTDISMVQPNSSESSHFNSSNTESTNGIYTLDKDTEDTEDTDTSTAALCSRHLKLLNKNNICTDKTLCALCINFKKIKSYNVIQKRLKVKHQLSLRYLKKLKESKEIYENILNEFRQSNLACNMCLINPCNVLFLPCCHICTCKSCHLAIPYSNSDKSKKIKTYLPNCPQCNTGIEAFVEVSPKPITIKNDNCQIIKCNAMYKNIPCVKGDIL